MVWFPSNYIGFTVSWAKPWIAMLRKLILNSSLKIHFRCKSCKTHGWIAGYSSSQLPSTSGSVLCQEIPLAWSPPLVWEVEKRHPGCRICRRTWWWQGLLAWPFGMEIDQVIDDCAIQPGRVVLFTISWTVSGLYTRYVEIVEAELRFVNVSLDYFLDFPRSEGLWCGGT